VSRKKKAAVREPIRRACLPQGWVNKESHAQYMAKKVLDKK